ncbi:nitrite reductase [Pseudothauera nasutitermitis]|nr:nitrite reductase [Pseudothauera nasutitermitis]
MRFPGFVLAGVAAVSLSPVLAQEAIDARQLYADNCAGCHQGGRVGALLFPPLTKERLGALSNNSVSAMIMTGIPGTLMPPWVGKLSADEITALATLIRTNSADQLDWTLEQAKNSLKVLVDEKSLPAAPTYKDKADVMDLMAVMQRGRHAQEPESRVVFYDGATNTRVGEIPVRRAPHILRYHPTNPRWAYVKTDTAEIYKIDLYSMQAVRSIETALSGPFFDLSWDGKWIAAGSIVPGKIMILDADTLEPVKQIKVASKDAEGKDVEGFASTVRASSVGGNVFAVAARTLGEVWVVEPNKPGTPVTQISVKDPGETSWYLYDSYTSQNQRYMYLTDMLPNNKIKVIDLVEKKYLGSIPSGCIPHVGSGSVLETKRGTLYFSPHQGSPKDCSGGSGITVWNEKGEFVKDIPIGGTTTMQMASNPNAPYLVVDARQKDGGELKFIDKETLEVVKTVKVGGTTGYPEYTRDGRYVYVAAGYMGDHLRIYDARTFEMVAEDRVIAPGGTFAHARVLWGGVKGAPERPLGTAFDKLPQTRK